MSATFLVNQKFSVELSFNDSELKKTHSADMIKKHIKALGSPSSLPVKKNIALDQFMSLWTEKNNDKNTKNNLSETDKVRIEERLEGIISKCETEAQEVVKLMNLLRNRETLSL